jgi:hypothetical protein
MVSAGRHGAARDRRGGGQSMDVLFGAHIGDFTRSSSSISPRESG